MKKSMRNITKKIAIMLIVLILFNFTIPLTSHAEFSIVGLITQPIKFFIITIFDAALHLVEGSLIGFGNVSWDWEEAKPESARTFDVGKVEIPNIKVSPDEIFTGQIPALNADFINPIEVKPGQEDKADDNIMEGLQALRVNIATWYQALRYIALIGLMCVLVYVGIRMVVSSTAGDKAKYKKMLMDWIVALCLIFFMHYIMAFTMRLTNSITNFFTGGDGQTIGLMGDDVLVKENGEEVRTVPNLISYVRVYVQLNNLTQSFTFIIVYMVLVIYVVYFVFVYVKRFVYLAFLTVIAPLVAMTYPLDKISDGQAQAFNIWLKEYVYNALLQPFHCLIYTVFVTMALELAATSLIYTCVVIGFMIPAEKFLKKMFGFDKASTASPLGAMATGAAMNKVLTNMKSGGNSSRASAKDNSSSNPAKFRTASTNYSDFALGGSKGGTSQSSNDPTVNQHGLSKQLPPEEAARLDRQYGDNSAVAQSNLAAQGASNTQGTDQYKNDSVRNQLETIKPNEIGETGKEGITGKDKQSREKGTKRKNIKRTEPSIDRPANFGSTMRNMLRNTGSYVKNNAGTLWRNKGKYGKQAAKFTAKKIGRGALRMAGMAALGTVGLAAGIATGDPSKVFAMAGLGVTAGWKASGRAANAIGNNKVGKSLSRAYNTAKYGAKGAAEIQDKKAYMKDEKRVQKFKDYYAQKEGENLSTLQAKEKMEEAYKYRRLGLNDDDTILKAMKFREKEGMSLAMAAKTAEAAELISGTDLRDEKKLNAHRERIISEAKKDGSARNDEEARQIANSVLVQVARYHEQDPSDLKGIDKVDDTQNNNPNDSQNAKRKEERRKALQEGTEQTGKPVKIKSQLVNNPGRYRKNADEIQGETPKTSRKTGTGNKPKLTEDDVKKLTEISHNGQGDG